ncbi:PepSY domain-containing protein [Halalkalibacter nanhaiisediminis]|uniref:Putative membrane protein YkoI n=1 Tax=Halalkalibacter nanhaiisediminis TaxID=688079 RepID=A0A562QHH2_9BACI|nr:PepSY domain-containing protein [Halalkalibacter nanhaiisediminis]TWI56181.1 putative membrane protein YkoI [Halalkalibacter nanhaiisediminis]
MNSVWRNRIFIGLAVVIAAIIAISFIRPAQAAIEEDEVRTFIQEQFDGRIYSLHENVKDGQDVYEIELLAEAGIYEIIVDQYSGEILSLTHVLKREEVDPSKWEDEEVTSSTTLSHEEIRELVQRSVGEDVTILKMELEEEDGQLIYDVKVRQSQGTGEMEINARTGEVLVYSLTEEEVEPSSVKEVEPPPAQTQPPEQAKEQKKEDKKDKKDKKEEDKSSPKKEQQQYKKPIGEKEAKRIALSKVAGKVEDIELDEDNGRLIYEIEIKAESEDIDAEVLIDAITGEVMTIIWED